MAGRNNHPKNDGPASNPSRLDQFGEKAQLEEKKESKEQQNNNPSC
jgi:hypothetical protein